MRYAMRYAYYPGCTAKSTAIEYGESIEETCRFLGIDLEEIPNWNCCGATSAHTINRELAIALPARNLALAERMCLDMVTSCPACFLRHKAAHHQLSKDQQLKLKTETIIDSQLKLSSTTKHILEVLYHDVGVNAIETKINKLLKGLKIVTYYGCYLVRPPEITEFDNPETPTLMDKIMEILGVEVIDWSYKVECCGGGLALTNPEIIKRRVNKICTSALEAGAEAIVTACHLCQSNLDTYQLSSKGSNPIPILFFSELTALAFGSTNVRRWLKKHVINPTQLLIKYD